MVILPIHIWEAMVSTSYMENDVESMMLVLIATWKMVPDKQVKTMYYGRSEVNQVMSSTIFPLEFLSDFTLNFQSLNCINHNNLVAIQPIPPTPSPPHTPTRVELLCNIPQQ